MQHSTERGTVERSHECHPSSRRPAQPTLCWDNPGQEAFNHFLQIGAVVQTRRNRTNHGHCGIFHFSLTTPITSLLRSLRNCGMSPPFRRSGPFFQRRGLDLRSLLWNHVHATGQQHDVIWHNNARRHTIGGKQNIPKQRKCHEGSYGKENNGCRINTHKGPDNKHINPHPEERTDDTPVNPSLQ